MSVGLKVARIDDVTRLLRLLLVLTRYEENWLNMAGEDFGRSFAEYLNIDKTIT